MIIIKIIASLMIKLFAKSYLSYTNKQVLVQILSKIVKDCHLMLHPIVANGSHINQLIHYTYFDQSLICSSRTISNELGRLIKHNFQIPFMLATDARVRVRAFQAYPRFDYSNQRQNVSDSGAQGSNSSTFYQQLLHQQIPKAQKCCLT